MINPERIAATEVQPADIMKERTLAYLGQRLAAATYPGYPTERLRVSSEIFEAMNDGNGRLYLPEGPWSTEVTLPLPNEQELEELTAKGLRFDTQNRPLHPWIGEMLVRPELGVVTGLGFYWHWGPNQAADPITIAEDTGSILLIKRTDTHQWALPGGFIDKDADGKDEDAQLAAQRELFEETHVETRGLPEAIVTRSYQGPVADIRTTANAWAETTSFAIQLPHEMPYEITDPTEVEDIAWVRQDKVNQFLKFGSHSLLVELALKQIG